MTKIWTISLAGNFATKTQTIALAQALRDGLSEPAQAEIVSFFPLPPGGSIIRDNNTVTWRELLTPQELSNIKCVDGLCFTAPWPNLVVSCRPEVAALALSIKRVSGGHSKVIHIQNPNGRNNSYGLDPKMFDLIVRQPHEEINGPNVISSELAIHGLTPKVLRDFDNTRAQMFASIQRPLLGVLVGGTDENVTVTNQMFHALGRDLQDFSKNYVGTLVILSSRRTGPDGTEILKSHVNNNPKILYNDNRFSEEVLIKAADAFIITADSLSMPSQALATDKAILLYDFDGAMKRHPLNSVFQQLLNKGRVAYFPSDFDKVTDRTPYNELLKLSQTIHRQFKAELGP